MHLKMVCISKSSSTTSKQEESSIILKPKRVKSSASNRPRNSRIKTDESLSEYETLQPYATKLSKPKEYVVEPRLGASTNNQFIANKGFSCPEKETRKGKAMSNLTNDIKRKRNERSKSRDTTKNLGETIVPIEETTVKSRGCQVISEYQAHSNSQARSEFQDQARSNSKDSSEFQQVTGGQTLSNSQDNSESYLAVDGQGLSSSQDGSESNREDQSNSRDNAESQQLSKDQALSTSKDLSESQSLTVDQLPSTSQDPSESNGQSVSNSQDKSESQPLLDDQDFSNSLHSSSSQSFSKGQDSSKSLEQSRSQTPLKPENIATVGIPSKRKTVSRTRWNHHTAATLGKCIKHKPLQYQSPSNRHIRSTAGAPLNRKPQLGTMKEEHVVCKVGDSDHDVVAIDDPFDQRIDEHHTNDNVDQNINNSVETHEHVTEFENKEQREPDDLQISPTPSYPKQDVEESKVYDFVDESVEEPPLGCVDYGLSISLRSHKILDRILSYEAPCWKWNPLSNSKKEEDRVDNDANGVVNDVDKRIDKNHELSLSHASLSKHQSLEECGIIETFLYDNSCISFGKTESSQEPVEALEDQQKEISKIAMDCIEFYANFVECKYEEKSNILKICHHGGDDCTTKEETIMHKICSKKRRRPLLSLRHRKRKLLKNLQRKKNK